MPADWLDLTTHRLDIYNESLAKVEFLEQFEALYKENKTDKATLSQLPTAYDYIRLGHPLSSVLEWAMAKQNNLPAKNVISFSSQTMPILAVLRKNSFENKYTLILYQNNLPKGFDESTIKRVYGYTFELKQVNNLNDIPSFEGSTIFVSPTENFEPIQFSENLDFYIQTNDELGSVILAKNNQYEDYISEIQHVRRRESIAMTPANCSVVLQQLAGENYAYFKIDNINNKKIELCQLINEITNTNTKPIVASSGLSTQYAIMMGLVDYAQENYPNKPIRIVVPPNCYGGTNDQARRVAACIKNTEVTDLPVDGGNDMVQSIDKVLTDLAKDDAVPLIIAEIPTNPRVEVPNLTKLKEALAKERKTPTGETAIAPVFILDQTFCPNVHFLGDNDILSPIKALAYVSGSKFPSGGKVTAGYCVANQKAAALMPYLQKHLTLCDNEATDLQIEILVQQMPSMNQRIAAAYKNTREFVDFIQETLPEAKINFVSQELAEQGFTPSVFSLDLPTKGNTPEEKETYKRKLNQLLIDSMITKIPHQSKYCVSYGQLKGCYWTIPATSTQGTTKEADKDYIARVSLSGNMDLELHKQVFKEFVEEIDK